MKVGIESFGIDFGESGFASTRRTPENHREKVLGFYGYTKWFILTNEMRLADVIIKGGGANLRGQWFSFAHGCLFGNYLGMLRVYDE